MASTNMNSITIGVLALQGAFEEHQKSLESISPNIRTIQIRTPDQLESVDGIVFPGGESTAMGLIGDVTTGLWDGLRQFVHSGKPTWGTCAGMILLAERCIGTSAVITKGQSLIGGVDILVCRNYFGSQVSSFEMSTPAPPTPFATIDGSDNSSDEDANSSFPGVFIRAPAILTAPSDVQVLGTVVAAPCRAAAVVLRELERKLEAGENVIQLGVVDALERKADGGITYANVSLQKNNGRETETANNFEEEKKDGTSIIQERINVTLPGASDETNAREVICAVRKEMILCTAFHPEIADDLRWHKYFVGMVLEAKQNS